MPNEIIVIDDENENKNEDREEIIEDEGIDVGDDEHDIIKNDDGTRTIILKYPINCRIRKSNIEKEHKITEITFRRISAGDLRKIADLKNDMDQTMQLLYLLSNAPGKQIFDRMDVIDLTGCMKAIEDFLPPALGTGKKS